VFGTRPEAVKMAPVVTAFRRDPGVEITTCATGQHREMAEHALEAFGIVPDEAFDVMRPGQDLTELTVRVLEEVRALLKRLRPRLLLVQGDTATAAATALAAHQARVPIGHVEAGLRTGDLFSPYPEEANRRIIGQLASIHLAPTPGARSNLLAEGVRPEEIFVTGNTVVDALFEAVSLPFDPEGTPLERIGLSRRVVLATAHRRENHGGPLRNLCGALRRLVAERPDVEVVFPVHPNPDVRNEVLPALTGVERIRLLPPQPYVPFVHLMKRSDVILTDSGGIQEEAPSLKRPVLVFRDTTERPEGVDAGCARLVGTSEERILAETLRLLDDADACAQMTGTPNPYGDGRAAQRILEACKRLFREARVGV
jgi:UDP-N-acetylglucosamine 2-epimerase (non-hydrolysing)